jgi:hypothetical protein
MELRHIRYFLAATIDVVCPDVAISSREHFANTFGRDRHLDLSLLSKRVFISVTSVLAGCLDGYSYNCFCFQ